MGPERFATSLGGQPVADAAKWEAVSQDACGVRGVLVAHHAAGIRLPKL